MGQGLHRPGPVGGRGQHVQHPAGLVVRRRWHLGRHQPAVHHPHQVGERAPHVDPDSGTSHIGAHRRRRYRAGLSTGPAPISGHHGPVRALAAPRRGWLYELGRPVRPARPQPPPTGSPTRPRFCHSVPAAADTYRSPPCPRTREIETWTDDACLARRRLPRPASARRVEELEATLAAIERSDLNAFSFLDPERALTAAETADVSQAVRRRARRHQGARAGRGLADTEASLVFKDRIADHTSTMVDRLLDDGGAVPVGLTTASEFGGLNVSVTKLNGITHNPWQHGRTVGRLVGRQRRRPWPAAWSPSRPGATAAARSASRPATPGCSG